MEKCADAMLQCATQNLNQKPNGCLREESTKQLSPKRVFQGALEHRAKVLPMLLIILGQAHLQYLQRKQHTEQQADRVERVITLDKQQELNKVQKKGKTKYAELDRKGQSRRAEDLQKAQQEKEAQRNDLASMQGSLGKANKALKESQSQLDTERKNHKSAMEEKERSNEKNRQELLKNNEAITKVMKESKEQLEQMREAKKKLNVQLTTAEQHSKSKEVLKEDRISSSTEDGPGVL